MKNLTVTMSRFAGIAVMIAVLLVLSVTNAAVAVAAGANQIPTEKEL